MIALWIFIFLGHGRCIRRYYTCSISNCKIQLTNCSSFRPDLSFFSSKKIRIPDPQPTDRIIITKSLPVTQPTLNETDPNLSQTEKPLIHRIVRRHFFSKNVDRKDTTKGDGKIPRYWNESCPCCSFWCCLITTVLISLLLLAGFITALVLLLANRNTTGASNSGKCKIQSRKIQ